MNPDEWAEFMRWWPIWGPAVVLVLGSSATGVWVIISRRGGEKAARRSPLPPTWPEMWQRIDDQRSRIDEQDKRIDELEDQLRTQRSEMIAHIVALEALVPNPPGPPARPIWN